MYFFEMMVAFFILSGVAVFFLSFFQVNMGEGMLLSASMAVLSLLVSSFFGSFTYGVFGMFLLAVLGVIMWGVKRLYLRQKISSFFSTAYLVLLAFFLMSLILFYNDYIQHIDEFHHWAATVKFMLYSDRMPVGISFGNCAYATSLFHLFFQKITGYSEQGMYVSSLLLAWIGFMLPFSECSKKDWKKGLIYSVIIYLSLYSLYGYATKSLYVDVPTAAWAGGLAGWWINRKKKKSNGLVAGAGLVMLLFLKQSVGMLMAVFVLLFMIMHRYMIENRYICSEQGKRKIAVLSVAACCMVIAGSLVMYGVVTTIQPLNYEVSAEQPAEELEFSDTTKWKIMEIECPESLNNMINSVRLSKDKAKQTLKTFITDMFGAPLGSKSNLSLAFFTFMLIPLLIFIISGDLYKKKEESYLYIAYMIFVALAYLAVLFFSYLFMFAYELSVDVRSGVRYFSICSIYIFVIALSVLFQKGKVCNAYVQKYVAFGVIAFFALGLNSKYIPSTTAINKENSPGYTKISSVQRNIGQIDAVINDYDKVYLIYQYPEDNLGGAELIVAPAYYYMEEQVSNYLTTPWKFTEEGSNIRLEYCSSTINDLPNLLTQGGYTYVWIYQTDKYLKNQLPEVLECSEVGNGYLYKIIYENGVASGLELAQILVQ